MITYEKQLALARRLREYLDSLGASKATLYAVMINFHTLRDVPSDDDPRARRDVELLIEADDPLGFADAWQERHGGGRYVDVLGDSVYVFGEASTAVRWRLRIIPATP